MPPAQVPTPQKIEWNKVTWYSGILAVFLFVALVCGAFYFGIWYQAQLAEKNTVLVTNTEVNQQQVSSSNTENESGIIPAFKVAAEIPNSFDEGKGYPNAYLVIGNPVDFEKGGGCGGRYNESSCYFFVKLIEDPHLMLYSWRGKTGSTMNTDSLKFVSKYVLQFNASFGDAGGRINEIWQFDVYFGSSTLISTQESGG